MKWKLTMDPTINVTIGKGDCTVHVDRILSDAEYRRLHIQSMAHKAIAGTYAGLAYKKQDIFYSRGGLRHNMQITYIPGVTSIEQALQTMLLAVSQEGDIK